MKLQHVRGEADAGESDVFCLGPLELATGLIGRVSTWRAC